MNTLMRVALWAYPREFRRVYGTEWARTVNDLNTHGRRSTIHLIAMVFAEAATVGVRMRWETLMPTARATLTVIAVVIAVVALVVGSPAIGVLAVALVALFALQFAGRDRPITPTDPVITRRWWLWLTAGATAFLIGLAVVAIDGDDDLSTAAWATWLISWTTAILLAAIGIGLAATHLITTRR